MSRRSQSSTIFLIVHLLTYKRIRHKEPHLKWCPGKLHKLRPQRQMTCLKKDQWNFSGKDGVIGQVTIGSKKTTVCVPGNSVITVLEWTNKIPSKISCLVEQAELINRFVATTKVRSVPVILINTTKQNVWIWQPLLAAELFTVDQIEGRINIDRKGDNISISFLPVAPNIIRVQSEQVEVISSHISPPTSSDKPAFGSRPNTKATDYDFEVEIHCVPFKLKMGKDAEMTHAQQSQFINIILRSSLYMMRITDSVI